jgi:hypothetical protein
MVSIPKVVGVLRCGVLLGLGLMGNAASAADKMKADQSSELLGGQAGLEREEGQLKGAIVERGETIQGEVLRFDRNNFLVQRFDGKEVRLYIDQYTRMTEFIGQGDRIEAKVNDQADVLSIRSLP